MKLMFYSSDNSAVEVDIYQRSMQVLDNDMVFMASTDLGDVVIITSNGQYRILELNHDTAMFLRKNFPFTAPSRVLHLDKTIGTENVLEIANDEYTAYIYASNYTPVLAQHSNNGLQLTGRSFEDILDSATFEVFKNGYKKPWGAGGNNLKKPEEIEQVISCGYTMVTLDCSDYINTDVFAMSDDHLNELYTPDSEREKLYIEKTFDISPDLSVTFDERSYKECAVAYGAALDFIEDMYALYFQSGTRDFEISIYSALSPTQHFFISNELTRRGVKFDALSPNFISEIQFEDEFKVHSKIAENFAYKISVRTANDRLDVMSKITAKQYNVKLCEGDKREI